MENEKRLIDANAFFEEHCADCKYFNVNGICDKEDPVCGSAMIVAELPTIDAVEVVHGRWTPMEVIAKKAGYGVRYYRHAECEVNPCRLFECMSDYCPNCGAKMDGGNEDA